MAITLEEYLKKNEELTLQEQENKRAHKEILDGLDRRHRENVCREQELYNELRRKEERDYMDKVQELQRRKRELKTDRLLTYQQECAALGKEE